MSSKTLTILLEFVLTLATLLAIRTWLGDNGVLIVIALGLAAHNYHIGKLMNEFHEHQHNV